MEDTTSDIVTLTITLDDVEPRVWRRLEVPADYGFDRLHQALNAAMGWLDLHLHEFEVAGERYGDGVDMSAEADATLPEADLVIGDVAGSGVRRIAYRYDFGDDWWHTCGDRDGRTSRGRTRSTRVARMARALAGRRTAAGRPASRSSSGRWRIPRHPEHKELLEWYGGEFDPDAFSVDATSAVCGRWRRANCRRAGRGESGCGRDNGARILWPRGPPRGRPLPLSPALWLGQSPAPAGHFLTGPAGGPASALRPSAPSSSAWATRCGRPSSARPSPCPRPCGPSRSAPRSRRR